MEGMREMALADYENLSEEEKVSYQNDFTQAKAEESVSKYLHPLVEADFADKCLEMYMGYTKGSFNFNDFITLRYVLMNKTVLQCDGCSSMILGQAFFSCHDCFFDPPKRYDLCCSCYASKKFKDHNHSKFYDSRTLLEVSRTMREEGSRTIIPADKNDPKEMSDIFEGVMIDFASHFMELARSFKTEGWKDFRRIPDNLDRRDAKEMATKYAEKEDHAKGSSENIAGKVTKEEENSIKLQHPSQIASRKRSDLVGAVPSPFNFS